MTPGYESERGSGVISISDISLLLATEAGGATSNERGRQRPDSQSEKDVNVSGTPTTTGSSLPRKTGSGRKQQSDFLS